MKSLDFSTLVPIGTIGKSIGYKLALRIDPYPDFVTTWKTVGQCLIKVSGIWAPFFIKSKVHHKDFIEVQFEDIYDDQEVKKILHEEIFVRPQDISEDDQNEEQGGLEDWVSFTILDNEQGMIGVIQEVEELPGQIMAMVLYGDKKVAVPLTEDLILEIDVEKKTILMNLPIGLLDL
jgi:16S rRNA processing protein RimM